MSILIVEDDADLRVSLVRAFEKEMHHVQGASSYLEALSILKSSSQSQSIELIVSDVNLGDGCGIKLLQEAKVIYPTVPMILMTGYGTIKAAVEAVKNGAYQYLTKPVAIEDLLNTARLAILMGNKSFSDGKVKQPKLPGMNEFEVERSMVGNSSVVQGLLETIKKVADTDTTVLITGESGTGKEVVARAIHYSSLRSDGPFVAINCGAIPRELLESELFGHIKGAFTGAHVNREGKILAARGGTLFLDEIGDMPMDLQVKLLRFLQTKVVEPVGSTKSTKVDVRILAATNVDLEEMVRRKKFREDFYYRLNVIPIQIAPLRERRDDIPVLLQHFLRRFAREKRRDVNSFSSDALNALEAYDWPGNIRELENLVERLVVMVNSSSIQLRDLPEPIRNFRTTATHELRFDLIEPKLGVNLPEMMSTLEDDLIKKALQASGGNKQKASQMLGLNRTTLVEKMKKRGIPLTFPNTH